MVALRTRRGILSGAVVAAVVLGLASVAFACSSSFNGTLKVSGNGGAATAIGSSSGAMSYCPEGIGWPKGTLRFTHGIVQTLTVVMESNSGVSACTNYGNLGKMKAGLRGVVLQQTHAFTNAGNPWLLDPSPAGDCMWATDKTITQTEAGPLTRTYTAVENSLGTLSVDASGNATKVVTYSANAFTNVNGEAGDICVTDGIGFSGTNMEAPIVFV